jgi:hypothetical protein
LPGGDSVLLVASTTLETATIHNGSRRTILPIQSAALVAISPDTSKVAVFNTVTQSIDSYSFSKATGVSFINSSKPLPAAAHAVAYIGKDIVVIYSTPTNPGTYTIKNLSTGEEITRLPLGPQLIPDRIKIDHE